MNRFAVTAGNTNGLEFDQDDNLPDSATYAGDAAGMSVYRVSADDMRSGAFTADVTLTLEFGDMLMLGGTISNFDGGAVGANWSVTLEEAAVANGEVAAAVSVATGRDGEWTAETYGATGARPTGIFGGFTAHFSDGDAAGAYATRK